MARTNSFEGGSDETTVTNGNSGGTSGTAFTLPVSGTGATVVYDNAQALHGSFSCRTATGGTSALAYTNWTWTAKSSDHARAHFRFASLPSAQQVILRYLLSNSQALRVNVTTGGALEVRNAANNVAGTTTATISAGSWFRVETRVVASTTVGVVELRLYLSPNSSTPTETLNLTGLALTANVDEIRFGVGASMSNAVQVWQDAVAADGTAFFGPALVTGAADRATTFGTAVVGTPTVLGTAARASTFGTAAAGSRTVLGTAARATTAATAAAGTRTVAGAGDRQTTFGAAAAGTKHIGGTVALDGVFGTTASGARTVLGQTDRTTTFGAPAAGGVPIEHDPTGTLTATLTTATLTARASRATLAATAPAATLTATT